MTHKPNYIDAIISLYPNAKCTYQNEDLSTLIWEDENPNSITEKQITDKHSELMAEYNSKEYQRKRKEEYPTIEELVVALYDTDDKADIETKRAAVKAKYPKPA